MPSVAEPQDRRAVGVAVLVGAAVRIGHGVGEEEGSRRRAGASQLECGQGRRGGRRRNRRRAPPAPGRPRAPGRRRRPLGRRRGRRRARPGGGASAPAGSRPSRPRPAGRAATSWATESASGMSRSPYCQPPPWTHTRVGAGSSASRAVDRYQRTGTGPSGPATTSSVRETPSTVIGAAGGTPSTSPESSCSTLASHRCAIRAAMSGWSAMAPTLPPAGHLGVWRCASATRCAENG